MKKYVLIINEYKTTNKNELAQTVPVYAHEKVKKINFLLSIFSSFNYMIWGDA